MVMTNLEEKMNGRNNKHQGTWKTKGYAC
jgi:hypothetical protein